MAVDEHGRSFYARSGLKGSGIYTRYYVLSQAFFGGWEADNWFFTLSKEDREYIKERLK